MCFETIPDDNTLKEWMIEHFRSEKPILPFSFKYGGQYSAELFANWKIDRVSNDLDESQIQGIITYTDSDTGLEIKCVAIEYKDFPIIEWTIY
jgi:hypothetical protein